MRRLDRVLVRLLTVAMSPADRERYREQLAADLDGATEVGLSRASVARGQARTAASVIDRGDVMPHPVGPLAIALRHSRTRRGPVLLLALVLGAALLAGVGVLLL